MFYKCFIQLCILIFQTLCLFFNKKIEFRKNFIKEFRCFEILLSWVVVQHINEVFCNLTSDPWETGSRGCRHKFLEMIWHANCSFQDASRNLHNKWTYSGFWIFFSSNLLRYFSESNSFLWQIYCIGRWVKKSLLGTISLSKMHFIDVFHIFVNALLSEYSEIRMNAMYMKHWQGWGEYLTGWREVPLIILVHMTPPCLTTESIQSIFSM